MHWDLGDCFTELGIWPSIAWNLKIIGNRIYYDVAAIES